MLPSRFLKYGLFALVFGFGLACCAWLLRPPGHVAILQDEFGISVNSADIESVIAKVDGAFEAAWKDAGVVPAAEVDSLLWARRLSLGLAGAIPSLEEIRRLETVDLESRRSWWVNHLLSDRRSSDHLAERFARALVGVENGPFVIYRRRRFKTWLSDQLAENISYGEISRQIIEGTGLWTDTPSVNFTTVTTDQGGTDHPDPVRLAARTTRAFLGLRIDCLQCHDDFLGTVNLGASGNLRGGTQVDFHKLAAFFVQAKNSLAGVRDDETVRRYEYRLLGDDSPTLIEPDVPFQTELWTRNGTLRHQLANWVTHPENRQFARTTTNRVWAILFGRPLVSPVDDIPIDDREVPLALRILAEDFADHEFDLNRLIRIIAQLKVYRLGRENSTDVAESDRIRESWAAFPLERLRPEQVAGSVIQATSLTTLDSTAHILLRLTGFGQQNEFIDRYGDFGENEFTSRGETVAQRLVVLNGEMVQDRIESGLASPTRLAVLSPDPETAVELIYLVTMSRRPDAEERERFVAKIENSWADNRVAAVRDLYWSLLNSAEFAWGH